eukprot:TRINITY_DN20814_c0_g1_i1.p1 TRINITY_DN20814_c0_g1~~TRINITY_DN20814_c0_g1_i1.p1  ORF type:complete len:287 (-),score=25.53 TRINITY_DN20814_c0_g1_i1:78-845(-)
MARIEHFRKKLPVLNSNIIAVCAHGGGGSMFGENHPVVQLLLSTVANEVCSVELPGHGSNAVDTPVPADVAAEQIFQAVGPVVRDRQAVFVGYSVGGIFLMKLWPRLRELMQRDSVGVFVGSGLRSNLGWPLINNFWQPEAYVARNKALAMEKLHGPGWKATIESVRLWNKPDSAAFSTASELHALFSPDEHVFLVLGDADQPFPLEDNLFCMDTDTAARKVVVVPSDHFRYVTVPQVLVARDFFSALFYPLFSF